MGLCVPASGSSGSVPRSGIAGSSGNPARSLKISVAAVPVTFAGVTLAPPHPRALSPLYSAQRTVRGGRIQGPLDAPASQWAQLPGDGEKRTEGRRRAVRSPDPCGRLGGPRLLSPGFSTWGLEDASLPPWGLGRQPPGPCCP